MGEDTLGKKGRVNELKIDEEELPSIYLPNAWCCLYLFLMFGSQVLIALMCSWSLKVKVKMFYTPIDEEEDALESIETAASEGKAFLLIVPPKAKGQAELAPVCEPNSNKFYTFEFQHIRFEIFSVESLQAAVRKQKKEQKELSGGSKSSDDVTVSTIDSPRDGGGNITQAQISALESLIGEEEVGIRVVQSQAENTLDYYKKSKGLQSEEQIEKHLDLYGANVFALPYPTFLELFQKQLQSPMVAFQLFCTLLWSLDSYLKYTLFSLATVLGFEASTAFQRLKQMANLRGMGGSTNHCVWVYRRNRWINDVGVTELLPGDIISLAANPTNMADNSAKSRKLSLASGPGSIKPPNANAAQLSIPCDCIILSGSAVVNEASLTGESVPQLKDSLSYDSSEAKTRYELQGRHKVHTLYSGTTLIQTTNNLVTPDSLSLTSKSNGGNNSNSGNRNSDASETSNAVASRDSKDSNSGAADLADLLTNMSLPPDGGILCYVIRTGFGSSQGELMRMVQYSNETVQGNTRETVLQLLFLFTFAMMASGYVLKKGLEDPERPVYKVLLRCVLILTQVVPASLPMQTAFAVHQALMNLTKTGIFCTEPFRVPLAGKIKYLFFDKTGTLTADQMIGTALVIPKDMMSKGSDGGKKGAAAKNSSNNNSSDCPLPPPNSASYKQDCLRPMSNHKDSSAAYVIAGCTALTEVNGALCGDPIELAGLRGIEWSYDGTGCLDSSGDVLTQVDAILEGKSSASLRESAEAAASVTGGDRDSNSNSKEMVPAVVPGLFAAKEKALRDALEIYERESAAERKAELKKDIRELEQKVRAERDRAKSSCIQVVSRNHFASALQRMSTVCKVVTKGNNASNMLESGVYAMVKGSPEALFKLLDKKIYGNEEFKTNFDNAYRALAQQGHRVLALGFKKLDSKTFNPNDAVSKIEKACEKHLTRDTVECDLRFAGFASFRCETRKDSQLVVESLNQSAHKCVMLTGDAALTAYSVALEVSIAQRPANRALVMDDDARGFRLAVKNTDNSSSSSSMIMDSSSNKKSGSAVRNRKKNTNSDEIELTDLTEEAVESNATELFIPFTDAKQLETLPLKEDRDIVVTGKALASASDKFGDELWLSLSEVCVFARLSPQQKENIIRAVGGHHFDNPNNRGGARELSESNLQQKEILAHTLMCGDGGNDVGALKQADVGVALLSGFGNANVNTTEKKEKASSDFFSNLFGEDMMKEVDPEGKLRGTGGAKAVGKSSNEEEEDEGSDAEEKKETRALAKKMMQESAEERLEKMKQQEAQKQQKLTQKMQEEFKRKQSNMLVKQQKYVEEELEKRRKAGLEIGIKAQMAVMQEVMQRMKMDMEEDRKVLMKQHASCLDVDEPGTGGGIKKWTDGLEKAALEAEAGGAGGVRLGDASIAAPFTSRSPSIMAVVSVIRQGRCTLLSGTQQMCILMIDSMITAFSLSMMSADGTRPAEQQMMASGTLLSIASIAFSFARPLDRLHPVRPLSSVFHPALFSSLLGQLLIHLTCMVFVSWKAKELMGEAELAEVLKFEKERNSQIALMELEGELDNAPSPTASWWSGNPINIEDAFWFSKVPFRPNLLNTCVWLVEVSQQISVLFTNYKGDPWMLGMLRNQPLFLSLIGCITLVWVCASNIFPAFNSLLKLAPVPAELKLQMIFCLAVSMFGAFMWDRFCHYLFAPEIFEVMWKNVVNTRPKDFKPLGKTLGMAAAGLFVLSSGNIMTAGGMYYMYKRFYKQGGQA